MDSIDELSTDDDSDEISISTNVLKEIWYRSRIHPGIDAIDANFKIRDRILKTQNKWKGAALPAKLMGKGSMNYLRML